MSRELLNLQNKIEHLRKKLNLLLYFNEPTDNIVIKCSTDLDKLIVRYEKIKATEVILYNNDYLIKKSQN